MTIRNKRILLIEPPFYRLYGPGYSLSRLPLGLAYVTAVIRQRTKWDVLVYNADFSARNEPIEYTHLIGAGFRHYRDALTNRNYEVWEETRRVIAAFEPDVVGISAKSQNFKSACIVASIAKDLRPQVTAVLGGPHPSMVKDDCLKDGTFDMAVIGEGEDTAVDLLGALESGHDPRQVRGIAFRTSGETRVTEPRPLIRDLNALPFPNEIAPADVHEYDKYPPTAFKHIFATRGCPNDCAFCGSKMIWTRRVRFRTPENVIAEIKALGKRNINSVDFADDYFGVNKDYLTRLCTALLDQCPGLKWRCEIHERLVTNENIALMKKSGCYLIQLGVESGSNELLAANHKNITAQDAVRAARIIRKNRITLSAFFMIGFPDETEKTIRETRAIIKKIQANNSILSIFTPYPGTEAFEYCKSKGLIPRDFDLSLFNHQSPENCFAASVPAQRFRCLAKEMIREATEQNERIRRRTLLKGWAREILAAVVRRSGLRGEQQRREP